MNDIYPDRPDYVPRDEVMREPIKKLAQLVTDRAIKKFGNTMTADDAEYWALASILTDEEAEFALKFQKRRTPRTFDWIVKNTGCPADYCRKMLDRLSNIGIVEYNWENPEHIKQWVLPCFVPGSAEFTNMNENLLKEHPEMGMFFNQMSYRPMMGITQLVPPGGPGVGMHVIPVEKAISEDQHSIGLEHISYWLSKYEGKYAASPCSCRLSRRTYDESCADDPNDWCIAVGDMADYVVETGKGGRYIDKEEALAIFKQAEDNGFVHQITNIDGENKIFAICNCNIKVCYALRTSQLFNTPNLSRSAYVARVNPENCVACGRCVEYCPAGAVRLGQKLCHADGTPVAYPKADLPTERFWSDKDWNWNYRDDNMINCYDTGSAPCKAACPAHISIQGYLQMAKGGKYQEALELIRLNNPLPAVCGYVCNRRCEDACTRGTYDEPIAIDDVKRFICEQDLKKGNRSMPEKVIPKVRGTFDEKVAIIGSGPAGLTCAFYLAKMGYSPVIFEKNELPGGMLTYGIPSFVLPRDIIKAEIDVIQKMGVTIQCGVEVGKDISLDELRAQGFRAFFLAIGCQGGRLTGVSGEDAEEVISAVDFLRKPVHKKNVVVIGGGNVAVDVSRTAARNGAKMVSMYCLESRDIMPASVSEIALTEADGVSINNSWGPKEILKDEDGHVNGIVLKKCLSVFDDQHRFFPVYDEEDTLTVPCDLVVESVGQCIEWGGLLKDTKVELGRGNRPQADTLTYQTAEPDIFVGGDVYTGPKFAIDAIAAGRSAAESMHRFVQPHASMTIGRNRNDYIPLDKEDLDLSTFPHQERVKLETNRTLTEEEAHAETSRCLSCGASVVDENQCIGCGVCTTKCQFDAIHIYRDHPECSTMGLTEDIMKKVLPYAVKQTAHIVKNNIKKKVLGGMKK